MLHVDFYVHETSSHSRKKNTLKIVLKKRRSEYFDLRDIETERVRESVREREGEREKRKKKR